MIRHIVLLALSDDHDPGELSDIMHQLAALVTHLPGFIGFEHGPNRDFEKKSAEYLHAFVGTFTDTKALNTYAKDARHGALGARLVALCKGGSGGIMVADIETA